MSNSRGRRRLGIAALLLALVSGPSFSHDFWIEPARFRPASNSIMAVRLRVGDHFDGDPYARNPAHIKSFVLVDEAGKTEVPGLPGREPAGVVRIAEPGLKLIGYWSTHTPLLLEAERFEASLKLEGLEHIVRLRAETGDTDKAATEAFFRCAKALINVDGQGRHGYDRILGFPLELIPERNPYQLRPGEALPLHILFHGSPIEGVRIVAMNAGNPEREIASRSDVDGRVRLPLDRPGVWLIKGVHMVPAPSHIDADWESAWASLTFELSVAQ